MTMLSFSPFVLLALGVFLFADLVPCYAFSSRSSALLQLKNLLQNYKNYNSNSLVPNKPASLITSSTQLDAFRFGTPAASEAEVEVVDDTSFNELETTLIEPITDVCVTALRIATCALMIHHGIDKIDNVQGFSMNVVQKFFGFLPGDPSFWTISAAATQVFGAILLAVGFLSRPVALSMSITMITAVAFHLLNTGIEGFPLGVVPQHSYNYELAAMYVVVLTYFSASGGGKYSVDEQVFGGELNLYKSLYKKVFGGNNNDDEDESAAFLNEYSQNSKSFKFPWSS